MTATDLSPDPGLLAALTIDTTAASGRFVVVHTLTTLAAVNLNQDLTEVPKALYYGGVKRMRVSAQSLVRAARERMTLDGPGHQGGGASLSRLLPQQTARLLEQRGYDPADAVPAAALVVAAAGLPVDPGAPGQTLAPFQLPDSAPAALADLVQEHWEHLEPHLGATELLIATSVDAKQTSGRQARKSGGALSAAAQALPEVVTAAAGRALDPGLSLHIALFGRFLPQLPGARGSVRSAAAVAHGLGVGSMDLFTDAFIAQDAWQDAGVSGAAMVGSKYLVSGTLYRYAALDRGQLRANLTVGDPPPDHVESLAQEAERQFVTAITYALPDGRSSRTGSRARPTLTIAGSCDHPLTAAAAFEQPVPEPSGQQAAQRLAAYLLRTGDLRGGTARWIPPADEPPPALPAALTVEGA